MSFKLKNPYPDNTVPVFKVPMEDGVFGKANNEASSSSGFNIHVNQNINDTPTFMKVVEHENLHIDQMARGDMDYDDDFVYWKGQKIPRANLPEGAHNLPWEKEVYDKTDVDMSFKMRNGSGNYPAFANLSERQLIKSANAMASPLHNEPIKPSKIPIEGSKKAEQQKADLAKIGEERQVELNPNDPGYGDPDLGIKKYTSQYKASTPEQREKGNKYWASLSEEDKQKIRDKKSRYVKGKIEVKPRQAQLITQDTPDPKLIKTTIPKTPPGKTTPPRERIKTKKEIKREALSQYGPVSRNRKSIGGSLGLRNQRGQIKESKVLTKVFGRKDTMSPEAEAHYDEQLAIRKAKKHANRKTNTFLSRDEKTADYRNEYNNPGNTKVTRTSTTTKEPVGKMGKKTKGYVYIRKGNR